MLKQCENKFFRKLKWNINPRWEMNTTLVIVASVWFKISLLILVILLKIVFLSGRKLRQWRRKWHVFSTSQQQVQSEFNVSWKLFLNLFSWRLLTPSCNFVKYLIPFRFWQLNMLFAVGLINFKIFSLEILMLGAFWISGSSLFHSVMTDGNKHFCFWRSCA